VQRAMPSKETSYEIQAGEEVSSPVSSCSSSYDDLVTMIHNKKLSLAVRRHLSSGRPCQTLEPIHFPPASTPQFYKTNWLEVSAVGDE
jgi:hypothetical protein